MTAPRTLKQMLAVNAPRPDHRPWPRHPVTAATHNNLGEAARHQGDYQTARRHLERSLSLLRKARGEEHPDVATALNNLGALVQDQGDYPAARLYYQQALALNRKRPDGALSAASFLNNLGNLFQLQGDYALARSHYEEALATYEYEEFAEAEVARGRSLKGLFPVAGEEAKRDYEAWKKARAGKP